MQVIPFFLPQYHAIPENDAYWGEGFTEWTNVKKAKPLFAGHRQPIEPHSDVGYYNLLDSDFALKQEQIAEEGGIFGFAYWHYWFGSGKMALEKPLQNKLKNPEMRLPFCMAWANESWTGKWHGLDNEVIFKQEYPGPNDYRDHFAYLLPFFKDKRYIKIGNKPIFLINKPDEIPDEVEFVATFREEAHKAGLAGIYLIESRWKGNFKPNLYDGAIHTGQFADLDRERNLFKRVQAKLGGGPVVDKYSSFTKIQDERQIAEREFPVAFPNWDNTPRMGKKGHVLNASTPEQFEQHIKAQYAKISDREWEKQCLFIKSWNEWAEGNYLEPDTHFGNQYLEKISGLMFDLVMSGSK